MNKWISLSVHYTTSFPDQPCRSISRNFSLPDHTLPARPVLSQRGRKWLNLSSNDTTQPVDINEESLHPTTDRQWLKNVGIEWSMSVHSIRLPVELNHTMYGVWVLLRRADKTRIRYRLEILLFIRDPETWVWDVQWSLDNSNCRGPQKSLSYEKFELWVMLSLRFSHVATVASPFRSSVFHFLVKISKICGIFFLVKRK